MTNSILYFGDVKEIYLRNIKAAYDQVIFNAAQPDSKEKKLLTSHKIFLLVAKNNSITLNIDNELLKNIVNINSSSSLNQLTESIVNFEHNLNVLQDMSLLIDYDDTEKNKLTIYINNVKSIWHDYKKILSSIINKNQLTQLELQKVLVMSPKIRQKSKKFDSSENEKHESDIMRLQKMLVKQKNLISKLMKSILLITNDVRVDEQRVNYIQLQGDVDNSFIDIELILKRSEKKDMIAISNIVANAYRLWGRYKDQFLDLAQGANMETEIVKFNIRQTEILYQYFEKAESILNL